MRRSRVILLAAALILTVGGLARGMAGPTGAGAVDDARLARAAGEPANWLAVGGGRDEQHFSRLTQIDPHNVARLKPAWFAEFDTVRGQESEPVVVDGVMYVTTAWSKVYAFDAASGRRLWMYDPHVPGAWGVRGCCDVVNRGAAVYKGRVYVGAFDGRLIALDARTGRVAWSVDTVDPADRDKFYTITGAPRVVHDKVIIGNGGAEFPTRGYVTAYDAATGKKVWRFYTVPGRPGTHDGAASDEALETIAAGTWSGEWWKGGGGGTAWDAIVYDPELNRLYIGVGNGAPHSYFLRSQAKGDNLFLASIVALDPDTGKYLWHYQVNPGESWDYTASQPIILATLPIDGRPRQVLMQAPKNGFFYVIDRQTGRPISARPFVAGVTWAKGVDPNTWRPIDAPGNRYIDGRFVDSPGHAGGHNWTPMAFSPNTGLVYLPSSENAWLYQAADRSESHVQVDPRLTAALPPPTAYLQALDPVSGRSVWRVDESDGRRTMAAGVLATAGGLVFQGRGELTGELTAMAADSGKILWRYKTPNGIQAAPVTYAVRGQQYVAVVGGGGGTLLMGISSPEREPQPGRILVFKLDGRASLPPPPPLARAPAPQSEPLPAAAVAEGGALYGDLCARCHGPIREASNIVPDLRRSAVLANSTAWRRVVIDGALVEGGMVGWADKLNPAQAESVRLFVASEAKRLADGEGGRP